MDIDTKSYVSPNYSERIHPVTKKTESIRYIIIHRMALPFNESIKILCGPKLKVSSHYIISEDGKIYQLVPDGKSAWHAGVSSWQGITNLNESSIGIELNNPLEAPYSNEQLEACAQLCSQLKTKYSILPQHIIGHSDVAPDRKIDPGIFFDWSYLASHGIGIWPDENIKDNTTSILYKFGDSSPKILELQKKFKKLGYNISPTSHFDIQTNHVIRAFQAKYNNNIIQIAGSDFYKNDKSHYSWDTNSEKILTNLLIKIT